MRLRVLSPARDPVSDAPVTAYAREERGVSGLYWSVSREVLEKGRTDAGGSFELSSVAPGRVELLVDDPRFAPATAALSVFGAEPCEAEIVLSRGAPVIGRVLAPNGAPVAGARVFVDGYEPRGTVSREDGGFRLDGVPEGSVEIHATAPEFGRGAFGASGGWGEPVAIALRAGQTATGIDVVLPSPLFVSGRVVADGAPVASVAVNVVVYVIRKWLTDDTTPSPHLARERCWEPSPSGRPAAVRRGRGFRSTVRSRLRGGSAASRSGRIAGRPSVRRRTRVAPA